MADMDILTKIRKAFFNCEKEVLLNLHKKEDNYEKDKDK